MLANKKYLTRSGWQRFAKISAGLLGGYLIAALLHMALALWVFDHRTVLITSVFSLYIVWMLFMILPFLFKNGWKVLVLYALMIIVLGLAVYFGKPLKNVKV